MQKKVEKLKKVNIENAKIGKIKKREHLQHIGNEFERVCDSMGLKINEGMSKVITIKKDQVENYEKVRVNGRKCKKWTSLITWE